MYRFIIYLLVLIQLMGKLYGAIKDNENYNNIMSSNNYTISKSRQKKALAFPSASTVGMIFAVAIPIEVPNREVVFSYNFEANYNSPAPEDFSSDRISEVLEQGASQNNGRSQNGVPLVNQNDTNSIHRKQTKKHIKHKKKKVKRNAFITRDIVYRSIEMNLIANGFNGKDCLLKAICEAAELPFGEHNGVIGDLIHIILSPSSSQNDKILDDDYYAAEYYGGLGICQEYEKNCPKSVLDFISHYDIM